MTPKRVCLAFLSVALLSVDSTGWNIPELVTLGLTFIGVASLVLAPGLVLFGLVRRATPCQSSDLIWIAVAGPLVLAAVGLAAWVGGNLAPPKLICRIAAIALIALG